MLRGSACHQPLSTTSQHHPGDVFVSLCAPHVSAATDKLESGDDWCYAGLWPGDRAPRSCPCPHPQGHHLYRLLSQTANLNHMLPQMGVTLTQLLETEWVSQSVALPALLHRMFVLSFFGFGRPPSILRRPDGATATQSLTASLLLSKVTQSKHNLMAFTTRLLPGHTLR